MSRHESTREDLFAECTALTRRVELLVPGESEPLVGGCRANGAWSIYFGGDPCYHFDADGRLRRAFADGLLYRTQGVTLARLTREWGEDAVELLRHDLTESEWAGFRESMLARLTSLCRAVESGTTIVRRQLPEKAGVIAELLVAIRQVLEADGQLAPAIANRSG